jgi:hypothetical protein
MRLPSLRRWAPLLVAACSAPAADAVRGADAVVAAAGGDTVRVAAPVTITFARDDAGACRPCAMTVSRPGAPDLRVDATAGDAYILAGGDEIAYTALDGAGGYEGEGQSVSLLDLRTGGSRLVLRHYFVVHDLQEATTADGSARILAVAMHDGGLGMGALALVDPARGEVWFAREAVAGTVEQDSLQVLRFALGERWGDTAAVPADGRYRPRVPPDRVERVALRDLLARPVIENPRRP